MAFKLIGILLSSLAFGQTLRTTDFQQSLSADAPRNYIKNSGIEKNDANITDASSIASRTTTTPLEGVGSLTVDASSSGQKVVFLADDLQEGLLGQMCEGNFSYIGDGSLYKAYAQLGGVTVSSEVTLINTGTSSQPVSLSFPCGASTTDDPSLHIEATSASAASIEVDSVYLGKALNIGSAAQSYVVGTAEHPVAASCLWSTTSATYANFAVDADCTTPNVTGTASAPATKIPAVTFSSLPSGNYQLVVMGGFAPENSSTAAIQRFRVSDGTNTSGFASSGVSNSSNFNTQTIVANFSYITPQTNITFQIQGRTSNSGNAAIVLNDTSVSTTGPLTFVLYYFPTTSQQVLRVGTSDLSGFLKTAATTSCNWASTSASMASFGVDADCPVPTASGNLVAPATKIPAAVARTLLPGKYRVEAFGVIGGRQSTSGTQNCVWQIYDGTTDGGNQRTATQVNTGTSYVTTITSVFEYSSLQSNKQFEIRTQRTGGNAECAIEVDSADLTFTLIPLSQGLPNPYLQQSVTSASDNVEKVNRAVLVCSASASITSQSGDWIASIGNISSNFCTVTFKTNYFSGTPSCNLTTEYAGGNVILSPLIDAAGAASIRIGLSFLTSGSSTVSFSTSDTYYLTCQGPN